MSIKPQIALDSKLKFFSLLFSIFSICSATYVIVPLLPIYFVESLANGGLGWSRAEAFSLFGTFLALVYISPFIGGLFGDFIFGKSFTTLLGYILVVSGLISIKMAISKDVVPFALLSLAIGFGFVKVNLTASIGRLPEDVRQRGYEYYYIASSLGFVIGGLLSSPLFSMYAMTGVVCAALSCTLASVCFFFVFFGKEAFRPFQKASSAQTPSSLSATPNTGSFLFLLALGIPFFICTSQLTTAMPVFLHHCVNRTLGNWTVPTLWFGAVGSFIMMLSSPYLRKTWNNPHIKLKGFIPLKFFVGFIIMAVSFALTASFSNLDPTSIASTIGIPLLLCVHVMCCVADFHIRPLLFSSATSLICPRYHTLSTALVYFCVGLGGKLAGTLASYADTVGFTIIFSICSFVAIFCGGLTLTWWRRTERQELKVSAS